MYDPDIGGMQEVVKQLSERLAAKGHEVTIATSANPARQHLSLPAGISIREFYISGNIVRGIHGEIDEYKRFLIESHFDVVVNFAAQIWTSDLAFPLLAKIRGKKVFVPTGFSCLHSLNFRDYYEQMKLWLKSYDACVYLSEKYQDITFARDHGITNGVVIPNGADEREFLREPAVDIHRVTRLNPDELLVLLVGSHTGIKGHGEAISIFRKAAVPNSTLLIIGNYFGFRGCSLSCTFRDAWSRLTNRFSKQNILFRNCPREETLAAFKRADIFLFPSNIECSPIVLFECLASKTPFLATDVGNSSEIADWSGAGEIIPTTKDGRGYSHADIAAGARMLRDLFHNADRRRRMADQGFEIWKERFSWKAIAEKYEELYMKLCVQSPL